MRYNKFRNIEKHFYALLFELNARILQSFFFVFILKNVSDIAVRFSNVGERLKNWIICLLFVLIICLVYINRFRWSQELLRSQPSSLESLIHHIDLK